MSSRLPALSLLVSLSLLVAACSTKHATKISCKVVEFAPTSQPVSTSPQAALDWYSSHLAAAAKMPRSGYRRESGDSTKFVYVDATGVRRVELSNLGTHDKPRWAVQRILSC